MKHCLVIFSVLISSIISRPVPTSWYDYSLASYVPKAAPAERPLAGVNWYVDPSASTSTNVGTLANPWKTLSKITTAGNSGQIHAGDSILLKRGELFICPDQFNGMHWWNWAGNTCPSGTAAQPIVFSAYGPGSVKPNLLYPFPSARQQTDSTSKNVLSFEGVDYIIVDGLQFNDTRFAPHNNKVDQAYTLAGVILGERTGVQDRPSETNHCIVRNCYFNNCGMGIVMVGDNNTIDNNVMENFGNDYANDGGGGDFGANGITISGANNIIMHNYIKGAWAWSGDFGTNGGALEWFNTNIGTLVFANKFIDCGGVSEFGALAGNSTAQDIHFYCNIFINNGNIGYASISGRFTLDGNNIEFFNNIMVENDSSRWSGDHYPAGQENFPNKVGRESNLFNNSANPPQILWNVRNNIFYLTTGLTVVRSSNIPVITHLNNLAKFGSSVSQGASGWSYTPNVSEVLTATAISNIWTNVSSADAGVWDFHLKSGSPAQGIAAVIAAVTQDYDGLAWKPGARPAGPLQLFTPNPLPTEVYKQIQLANKKIIKL